MTGRDGRFGKMGRVDLSTIYLGNIQTSVIFDIRKLINTILADLRNEEINKLGAVIAVIPSHPRHP